MNEKEWFIEIFEDRTAFSVRYTKRLFDRQSDFQRVEIFETEAMGRVLILNGCFMVTEKDAFVYHEMLVHPAMAATADPRNVLIIGGGDGGAVTEVVKYRHVESVTLCEIDPVVVEACREHLPEICAGLDDPRVRVVYQDGAAFVEERPNQFDLIIVDSTDPVGPAKILFETSFYQSVMDSLREGGTAVFQTESPFFMEDVFCEAVRKLKKVFGPASVHPYFATIPCYPGGLWSFCLCAEGIDPGRAEHRAQPESLRYYDRSIHQAAFAAPVFVQGMLE